MKDLPDNWQHRDVTQALTHVRQFHLAVDAGAHRGIITRLLLQRFRTVVAFEPTVLAAGIPPEAVVHPVALGACRGRAALRAGLQNTGQTHVVPGDTVDVVPMDEYELQPDFIKMDVEGMELEVLLGAEITIRTHYPVIMFEDNGLGSRYGARLGDVARKLESWGYQPPRLLHAWSVGGDYVCIPY